MSVSSSKRSWVLKMRLLYPCDDFDKTQPSEIYREEYLAAKSVGLSCSLYSVEDFELGSLKPRPVFSTDEEVIYRGWMLTPSLYSELYLSIRSKNGKPITSPEQYRHCHYLPEWYGSCVSFTPKTIFCDRNSDFKSILSKYVWDKYFVKDYVKSLTTSRGSVAQTVAEIHEIIELIEKFKGCIEGGICIREFENFVAETEERYFIFKGRPFARDGIVPTIVEEVALRVESPFFSVDIIANPQGELRLIELGDGQVSDLKKWSPADFVKIFLLNPV